MILRLHHVQITAPKGSAAEVRRFYGEILGLQEIPVAESMRDRGLIWFKLGELDLHVGQEEGVDRTLTKAHLAYEVEDMQALRKHLSERGIEMFEQPLIAGYDRVHIRDPFGNRVEIIGRAG